MSTKMTFSHHPKNLILDYYHCTFFLPLIGLENDFKPKEANRFYYDSQSNEQLANEEAQAYRYFSPALRNILFDCKNIPNDLQAVKEWRIAKSELKDWQLHLGKIEDKEDPTKYQRTHIVSVRLFQYFNGIYLLAVRVQPTALTPLNQQNAFQDNQRNTLIELTLHDPDNLSLYQQLAMENWLHFTRHIRLLYPSFAQQNQEQKIAPIHLIRADTTVTAFEKAITTIKIDQKPGYDFSTVMIELLKVFAQQPSTVSELLQNHSNFYDDRMFVSVAYGIAGKKLPETSLRRINTLVSYVDRQEAEGFSAMQGYAYTPAIINEKVKKCAFPLWEGLGGYYTYTDFSNSYLSTGIDFRRYIAPEHIPHIYDRMLIQSLFYQASLRYYDNQICAETEKLLNDENVGGIRKQRGEFVRFTNQYWFHTVTSQMQGKEIFELQQKALGLQQHYNILKDELERTDEYLQAAYEIKMMDYANNFTRWGLDIAGIAIYYSFLPIINESMKTKAETLWSWVGKQFTGSAWGQTGNTITGIILLVVVPTIFFYAGNTNYFKKKVSTMCFRVKTYFKQYIIQW